MSAAVAANDSSYDTSSEHEYDCCKPAPVINRRRLIPTMIFSQHKNQFKRVWDIPRYTEKTKFDQCTVSWILKYKEVSLSDSLDILYTVPLSKDQLAKLDQMSTIDGFDKDLMMVYIKLCSCEKCVAYRTKPCEFPVDGGEPLIDEGEPPVDGGEPPGDEGEPPVNGVEHAVDGGK
ncbi:hypothetical protein MMC17_003254 [Xylographa soralifera]|nr:hypothetical protein [Xylographa soralifera]